MGSAENAGATPSESARRRNVIAALAAAVLIFGCIGVFAKWTQIQEFLGFGAHSPEPGAVLPVRRDDLLFGSMALPDGTMPDISELSICGAFRDSPGAMSPVPLEMSLRNGRWVIPVLNDALADQARVRELVSTIQTAKLPPKPQALGFEAAKSYGLLDSNPGSVTFGATAWVGPPSEVRTLPGGRVERWVSESGRGTQYSSFAVVSGDKLCIGMGEQSRIYPAAPFDRLVGKSWKADDWRARELSVLSTEEAACVTGIEFAEGCSLRRDTPSGDWMLRSRTDDPAPLHANPARVASLLFYAKNLPLNAVWVGQDPRDLLANLRKARLFDDSIEPAMAAANPTYRDGVAWGALPEMRRLLFLFSPAGGAEPPRSVELLLGRPDKPMAGGLVPVQIGGGKAIYLIGQVQAGELWPSYEALAGKAGTPSGDGGKAAGIAPSLAALPHGMEVEVIVISAATARWLGAPTARSAAEAVAAAAAAIAAIGKGESFAAVASRVSEWRDGMDGSKAVTNLALHPALANAAEAVEAAKLLKPGEIAAEPVACDDGFYVVKRIK